MRKKAKHSLYVDNEVYANFCDLAAKQKVPQGRMFEVLYDQYMYDTLRREQAKNETQVLIKSLQKQVDTLTQQTTMLIQMANTLGVKFNFQQLINTEINESGMVTEARQYVRVKQQRTIVQHQVKQQTSLND